MVITTIFSALHKDDDDDDDFFLNKGRWLLHLHMPTHLALHYMETVAETHWLSHVAEPRSFVYPWCCVSEPHCAKPPESLIFIVLLRKCERKGAITWIEWRSNLPDITQWIGGRTTGYYSNATYFIIFQTKDPNHLFLIYQDKA